MADQTFDRGNLALARNQLMGLPVRVTRGSRHASPLSPSFGYRYGGLYRVEDHWHEAGKSGFRIYRFRLVKISTAEVIHPSHRAALQSHRWGASPRVVTTVQRLVRNTAKAQRVKEWHDFTCQVCGIRLETPAGPYAESAHIRPLGAPHHGPDEESNILCLCPNHHALFDLGAFTIGPDYAVWGSAAPSVCIPSTSINGAHLLVPPGALLPYPALRHTNGSPGCLPSVLPSGCHHVHAVQTRPVSIGRALHLLKTQPGVKRGRELTGI